MNENDDEQATVSEAPRWGEPRIITDPVEARKLYERVHANAPPAPPEFDGAIEGMRRLGVLSPDEPRPNLFRLQECIAELGGLGTTHERSPGDTVVVNALRRTLGLGRPTESAALDNVAAILAELLVLPPTPADKANFTDLPSEDRERWLYSSQTVHREPRPGILSNAHAFDSVCTNMICKYRPDGVARVEALHRAFIDADGQAEISVMALYYAEAAFAVLVACGLEPKPLERSYLVSDPFHPARLASNTLDMTRGFTSAPTVEDRAWAFMHVSREYHRMVLALFERRILSNAASVRPLPKESSRWNRRGERKYIEQWCRDRLAQPNGRPISDRQLATNAVKAAREHLDKVPAIDTVRKWIPALRKSVDQPVTTTQPTGESSPPETGDGAVI